MSLRQLGGLTIVALSIGGVTSPSLLASSLTWNSDARLTYDLADKRVGVWSWGALVVIEQNFTPNPVIRAFDRQARDIGAVTLTIPGAHTIVVRSATHGMDGTIAACGAATAADGRTSGFVARISSAGQNEFTTQTFPYTPYLVAIASDGTIWTQGFELDKDSRVNRKADVLRHFDVSGKLISSVLPPSSFSSLLALPSGYMTASRNRVGWYTGPLAGPGGEYIEISASGVPSRFHGVPVKERELVTGLALTDDGGTFVSTYHGPSRSWQILSLDKDRQVWSPILGSSNWGALYGGDGTTLAVWSRDRFVISFFDVKK